MRITRPFAFLACAPFISLNGGSSDAADPPAPAPLPPTVADGAKLEIVHDESATTKRFFEGPTYDPRTETLYFTVFGKEGSQILKLDKDGKVSVFLDKTDGINGTFLSRKGDLIGCQGEKSRVVRISLKADGAVDLRSVADSFDGKPLGKTNDLAEDARGGVYFTAPDFEQKKTSAVYYLTPEGKVVRIITDMPVPNGTYVGKGGLVLYVSDSDAKHIKAYEIDPTNGLRQMREGKVVEGRVFFNPPSQNDNPCDGMTMDENGNMYFTGRGGVWVVAPGGRSLGLIAIPEFCSNCTFGGRDGRTLYLTCQDRVYRLKMNVRGWEFASRHEAVSESPIRFAATTIDKTFRSEGAAIADVNKDGKLDILAGDVWYEAPGWHLREVRQPKAFNPAAGYSESFACFTDDYTGDGFADLVVIPFPGFPALWYENPKGKPERWIEHPLWHSACNETPLYAELLGNGKRQLIMAWQPEGKENEGRMSYFTPPASGKGKWDEHRISGDKAPGTFRFSHGLGVGDMNGDGRQDVMITEGWWEQPADLSANPEWKFHAAPLGGPAADMYAYDLDLDGLNDVISSSAHGYGIWWRQQTKGPNGETAWVERQIDSTYSQSHALNLVDMNGDGVKDLVTGKRWFAHQGHDPGEFEPVVVYWYEIKLEKGAPPKFTPRLINVGTGIGTQFVVSDLNGDKLLDIIVANKRGVHILEQRPGTAQ